MANGEKVKKDWIKTEEFESKNAGRKTAIEKLNKKLELFHFLQNLTENPNFSPNVSIVSQTVVKFFLKISIDTKVKNEISIKAISVVNEDAIF